MFLTPTARTRRSRSKGRSRLQRAKVYRRPQSATDPTRNEGARRPSLPVVAVFCFTAHVFTWAAADWYRRGLALLLGILPRSWSGFLVDLVQRYARQPNISDIAVATDVTCFWLGFVLTPGLGLILAVAFRRFLFGRR